MRLPFEDLSEVSLANPFLFGVKPLRVRLSLSNGWGELGWGGGRVCLISSILKENLQAAQHLT